MTPFQKTVKMLTEKAKRKGASSVKLILTTDVFVEDYVRQKCQYGCKMFGIRLTCPPYTSTPEETRKWLKDYKKALLIEFKNMGKEDEQRQIHDIAVELERDAFLSGLYRPLVLVSGPCRYCTPCVAEKAENRGTMTKANCKNPMKARPSMEAVGIEVYKTVRNAGLKVEIVKGGEPYKSFLLLLLE
ncbi:MAG: DUF2284 domain-containing protein [Methanobacteriota archaeon]